MTLSLMLLMLMMSIYFISLNHPLSFGMILLLQTVLTAIITGMMNYNYWFSYILFLIMVGSMLVLFIYMTSIASNEKFKFTLSLTVITAIFLMFTPIAFITNNMFPSPNKINYLMMENSLNLNNLFSLNKFMNFPSNLSLIMMMVYLLITLIAIVKITEIQYGPLRQKF